MGIFKETILMSEKSVRFEFPLKFKNFPFEFCFLNENLHFWLSENSKIFNFSKLHIFRGKLSHLAKFHQYWNCGQKSRLLSQCAGSEALLKFCGNPISIQSRWQQQNWDAHYLVSIYFKSYFPQKFEALQEKIWYCDKRNEVFGQWDAPADSGHWSVSHSYHLRTISLCHYLPRTWHQTCVVVWVMQLCFAIKLATFGSLKVIQRVAT